MKPTSITVLEMTPEQVEFAEKAAQKLGFTQTAYESSSLPGVYCLPDRPNHKHGVLIQTKEYGLCMFSDLEDLNLYDMADEERARLITKKAKEIV